MEQPKMDEILKRRDGRSAEEIVRIRRSVQTRIIAGESGFDIMAEYGLEFDHLEELLF